MSQLPKSILEHIADNVQWEASKKFHVSAMSEQHIKGTLGYIANNYRCKSFDSDIWTQVFEFELERRSAKKRIDELKGLINEANVEVSKYSKEVQEVSTKHTEAVEKLCALEDELSQLTK